jgi:hypothetical protein
MPTAIDNLVTALEGLSTDRLQRLVDRLERDPGVTLTVGDWRPHCPMVLAGFKPTAASGEAPEQQFAAAWDRFATPQARRRRLPAPPWRSGGPAYPSDVQLLLRKANAVLADRHARAFGPGTERSDNQPMNETCTGAFTATR